MTNEDGFHLNIEEGTFLFPIDVVSNNEIIEFINEIEDDEIIKETVDNVDNTEEEKKETGIKLNCFKVLRKESYF